MTLELLIFRTSTDIDVRVQKNQLEIRKDFGKTGMSDVKA